MIADPPVHTKAHRRSPWLLFVVCVLTLAISAQEEKRLTFYAAGKSFSVPVHERNNRDYVDLLEVLRPLGGTGEQQEHNKFRARIGGREAEFQRGKNKANIGGKNVDLTAPVFLERNTALVPVRALAQLLPTLRAWCCTFPSR